MKSTIYILFITMSVLCGICCSSKSTSSSASNTNTDSEVDRAMANARNAMETAANKAALAAQNAVNPTKVVLPGKRALVITKNANLRKSDDSTSEVVQTIPNGTNVEWVEQRGAWFSIRVDGKLGWMHGNTIRLLPQLTTTTATLPSSTSPSSSSDDVMRQIRNECARQAAAGDQSPLCGDVERNGIH